MADTPAVSSRFDRTGVLVKEGSPDPVLVQGAVGSGNTLTATMVDGSVEDYETTDITLNQSNGTLTFTASDGIYRIRDLRETDGLWLSKYKMLLDVDILQNLSTQESAATVNESLQAFAIDDSSFVVGLLYSDGEGTYSREGGVWMEVAPDDTTYQAEGLVGIPIHPDKAEEFVELFDRNYVTVEDAEKYEAEESDDFDAPVSSESEVPSDENSAGGPADSPLTPVEQADEEVEEPVEATEEADQDQE